MSTDLVDLVATPRAVSARSQFREPRQVPLELRYPKERKAKTEERRERRAESVECTALTLPLPEDVIIECPSNQITG